TVPMGSTGGVPVGLTLAGRAWDDNRLLALGAAVEATAPSGTRRVAQARTSTNTTTDTTTAAVTTGPTERSLP
ncbi:MAG: hypothetical protein L0J86_00005, partial [Corynebacterium sp.]|nr:hypothetical protein [Corynebacterium sp.]